MLDLMFLFFNEAFGEVFHRKVLVEEKVGFGIVKQILQKLRWEENIIIGFREMNSIKLKGLWGKKREKKQSANEIHCCQQCWRQSCRKHCDVRDSLGFE